MHPKVRTHHGVFHQILILSYTYFPVLVPNAVWEVMIIQQSDINMVHKILPLQMFLGIFYVHCLIQIYSKHSNRIQIWALTLTLSPKHSLISCIIHLHLVASPLVWDSSWSYLINLSTALYYLRSGLCLNADSQAPVLLKNTFSDISNNVSLVQHHLQILQFRIFLK